MTHNESKGVADNALKSLRILSTQQLHEIIPYSRAHILRLEKAGKFPRRLSLGPGRVGWLIAEIEAWIAERRAERDQRSTDAQTTEESLGKHETSASGATLEENTLADFDGNNELETSDLSQRAKSEAQPVRNIKDDAP